MEIKEITDFIINRVRVPMVEAIKFAAKTKVKTFAEGELVFKQGEVGSKTYILLSGLCYVFYLHQDGREKVKRFVGRGETLAPYISFLTAKPSNYSARVLKPVTCLEFNYADYMALVAKSWPLEIALRKELELQILERENKEFELFMLSAEERYQSFVERHEKFLDQIPQKLIASYINVDPATLSRMRAKD